MTPLQASADDPAPHTTDYILAGLAIRSEIPLPVAEAPAPHDHVDVLVSEGAVEDVHQLDRGVRPLVGGDELSLRLYWPGVAWMSVAGGLHIVVQRDGPIDPARVAPLVLGVGLGLVLHQRGRLVLHASAVALPEGGVAFVGPKGAGKSTIAGAFLRRGHSIITDDALPLDANAEGPPPAWPGPAPLKLWPESATALGRAPRRLQRLHPSASKRVVANLPLIEHPVPLRAIYSLDVGPEIEIQKVQGQEALVEIMRQAYAPRFIPAAGATPAHFERCARVARAVSVFRLARPADLNRLDEVAGAVERHVATLTARGPA